MRRGMRVRAAAVLVAACAALAALWSAPSQAEAAAASFDAGFADVLFQGGESNLWLDRSEQLGANTVRVNVPWAYVAPTEPTYPRNPSDAAYQWAAIDRAVVGAKARGMEVMLTVYYAPAWAEGPNRPSYEVARAGTWMPSVPDLGDFAAALSLRYGGSYYGLPEADAVEVWNEPNLSAYIAPQWLGDRAFAVEIYSLMLNEFYIEAKAQNPSLQIVAGSTAPYGDPPGGKKIAPARFIRELLCVDSKLNRTSCPAGGPAKFDILGHHPLNRTKPPTARSRGDDVMIADMGKLIRALRSAERQGATAASGPHPVWATELWWQSVPDQYEGVSLKTHARWTQQAMYLLWKQGVQRAIWLQLRDAPGVAEDARDTFASYQSGVYAASGQAKPSARAVRFSFVGDRVSPTKLRVWGRAPRSGKLSVRVKSNKRWKTRARSRVRADQYFTRVIKQRGRAQLQAAIGGEKSLIWAQTK